MERINENGDDDDDDESLVTTASGVDIPMEVTDSHRRPVVMLETLDLTR